MSDVENELRSRVDAFVGELSEIIRRQALAAVEELLSKGEGAGAAPRKAGRSAKAIAVVEVIAPRGRGRPSKAAAPKRRPGEKRTPQELERLVEQLFQHVKSNPGQGVEQIAKALGAATKELTLPIRKLIKQKRINAKGLKRATRYSPR